MANKKVKSTLMLNFFMLIIIMLPLTGWIKKNEDKFFKNKIETYRVNWWHLPDTTGKSGNWGRPEYGVINIDNGEFILRHAILEGRALGDYRIPYWGPYWGITSFVSIFNNSAEVAHQSSVRFYSEGKINNFTFRCGDHKYSNNSLSSKRINEGFEVAHFQRNVDILKVSNRGSECPVLMEHFFVVKKNTPNIPVYIKAINKSDKTMRNVELQISYTQDFNWDCFGAVADRDRSYQPITAPKKEKGEAFFAFSSGMKRGFEFQANEGCELSYNLSREFNKWKVLIKNVPTTIDPGDSILFSFQIRIVHEPPQQINDVKFIPSNVLDLLEFRKVIPKKIKNAPVNSKKQVTIGEVFQNLNNPKVRGLQETASIPKAFADLSILKDWGANLAVTSGSSDEVKQIVKYGHQLGMEMFVQDEGGYSTGEPPKFDHLFMAGLKQDEYPDAYGQDEDHYYWYPVKPAFDFESEFGKPMGSATQKEKVEYWSRCFVSKWRVTLESIRKYNSDGNIFFYIPTPSIANIDPLDYYDTFFNEVSKLGNALTVFPFYYGTDYNQIEYMVRRWKDAGIQRVVFLLGGPTYSSPSQFMRAVTEARRGGADGVCGFAFLVDEEVFDDEWRWKSVMLAAQANFPTQELNAYCFIEEPAELVEALSRSYINVVSNNIDAENLIRQLDKLFPGKIRKIDRLPEKPGRNDQIYIVMEDDNSNQGRNDIYRGILWKKLGDDKGLIRMDENIVKISGSGVNGIQHAENLLLRFAWLALAESRSKH